MSALEVDMDIDNTPMPHEVVWGCFLTVDFTWGQLGPGSPREGIEEELMVLISRFLEGTGHAGDVSITGTCVQTYSLTEIPIRDGNDHGREQ